jgi:large subunit ribosomal protein L17
MITRAKSGTLHDRREVAKFLTDTDAVKKLFTDLAELYKGRNGGYTRVLKLRNRAGDNAETALIELVDMEKVYKKEEPAAKKGEKKPKEAKPAKEPKAPKAPKAEKAVKEEKPAKKEKKADKK